ncbi:MAG: hypothetical protein OHK0039_40010 [Bacteroidia bacterium]
MYTNDLLERMDMAALADLARQQQIDPVQKSKAELIALILQAQQSIDASGFVGDLGTDSSGFVTTDKQSGTLPIDHFTGDGSGFVGADTGDGSGFIQEQDGSGFIGGDTGDGSGFIQDKNDPLGTSSGTDILGSSAIAKSRRHNLGPGDRIELGGTTYTLTAILSQDSGEAVIYKVQAGSEERVLKLYFEQTQQEREPNREALSRIREIRDRDILTLHDFGVGADKYQGRYCYEISDLARGGTLFDVPDYRAKYTPAFVEQHLIPEIYRGLRILHQNKIFHGDIKPQNIFYLDEAQTDLVIGDYGSAKTFDHDSGKTVDLADTLIATRFYMAPEQGQGIVSEKNDYYSFGMVLLHLLYPEQFAQDDNPRKGDRHKHKSITLKRFQGEPIVQYDPAYKRINDLIAGLTLERHENRWGASEVGRWLRGEYVPVAYTGTAAQPIKLGYATVRTPEDLIAVIEGEPNRWYGDLITDSDGYKALIGWYTSISNLSQKKVFEGMIQACKPEGALYVKEAILRYFQPELPARLGQTSYTLAESQDLRGEIRRYFADLDSVWKKSDLSTMRFALFQFEFALRQALPTVDAESRDLGERVLQSMAKQVEVTYSNDFSTYRTQVYQGIPTDAKKTELGYGRLLRIFYALNRPRFFRDLDNREYSNLEEVGLFFARNPKLYDQPILRLERAFFLNSVQRSDLARRDLQDFLFDIFQQRTQTQIQLQKLVVDKDRKYLFNYAYRKSLTAFFQQQKINPPFGEGNFSNAVQEVKKGPFELPQKAFDRFLEGIQQQHKIPREVIPAADLAAFQRKFLWSALRGHAGHGLSEWYASLVLLLPFALWGGLLLLGDNTGRSLLMQYFEASRLNDYVSDGEAYGHLVAGMYLVPIIWALAYLLALVPKLWAGPRLQLAGQRGNNTPRLMSIGGNDGFLALLWLLALPVVFYLANFMLELLAMVLCLLLGQRLLRWRRKAQSGKGISKWQIVIVSFMVFAGARIALEALQFQSEGGINWEQAPRGRGFIDLAYLVLAGLIFFLPPLAVQLPGAHNRPRFFIKLGAWVLLLLLWAQMSIRIGGWQKQNWFRQSFQLENLLDFSFVGTPDEPEPPAYVADTYLARITDNYAAINLRAGRGNSYQVLDQVPRGEEFLVQTHPSGWHLITRRNGMRGYMYKNMIDLSRQAVQEDLTGFPAYSTDDPQYIPTTQTEPEPPREQPRTQPREQPQPQPRRQDPAPSGERIAPRDPSRMTERELKGFLQQELTEIANPALTREDRRARSDALLPYFVSTQTPVTVQLSSGRPTANYGIQAYLVQLRITGRHLIYVESIKTEGGKVSALAVRAERRP